MNSADPIRLALVITELAPGGAERCLVEIATRLDRRRFAPEVYSLGPPPPSDRQALVQRLAQAEIPTHLLNLRRSWHYFRGVRRLADLLRRQRAEVVQTFLFHANVLGARAARMVNVPLATGLRVADPRRWRVAMEHWAAEAAQRHVCVSQSVADYYRHRGFPSEKLLVIPNGIDAAMWRDAQPIDLASFGLLPGRRCILYVGRLEEQKGLLPFFRQLPRLFQELPNYDLVLVGAGPQRDRLTKLAGELGLSQRVHFAGWQADVPGFVAAADLVVLPSRWEGMPNAVLEAMAAGKPVAASVAEGVVELLGGPALTLRVGEVADEQTAPLGDAAALGARVVKILRDEELARRIGTRNQQRAFQQFSIDNCVAEYGRLFAQIANR